MYEEREREEKIKRDYLSSLSQADLHFQNSGPSILTWAGCKLCMEHQVCMWASTCMFIQILSLKLAEEESWLCRLRACRWDRSLFWNVSGAIKIKDCGWCGGFDRKGEWKEKSCTIHNLWLFSSGLDAWGIKKKRKSWERFKAATEDRTREESSLFVSAGGSDHRLALI